MNIIARTLLEGILNEDTYDVPFEYEVAYLMESLDLRYDGVITEAMHPSLRNLPTAAIKHIASAGGGSHSEMGDSSGFTADGLNSPKLKAKRADGHNHFAISDKHGQHLMSFHYTDDGKQAHVIHADGQLRTMKSSDLKGYINGHLEGHASHKGLDRKKDFSVTNFKMNKEERDKIKQGRTENRNFKNSLTRNSEAAAGKLFDKHTGGNNNEHPDDTLKGRLTALNASHVKKMDAHYKELGELHKQLSHPSSVSDPDALGALHDKIYSKTKHIRQEMDDHKWEVDAAHRDHKNAIANKSDKGGSGSKEDNSKLRDDFIETIGDSRDAKNKAAGHAYRAGKLAAKGISSHMARKNDEHANNLRDHALRALKNL